MQSTAQRRYNLRAALMMTSYVLVLIAVDRFFDQAGEHSSGLAVAIIAALPALPIIGVFALMGRYLAEERDEYVRMLHIRQVLVATGFALSAATVWGFLENFGQVPHLYSYWVAIAWFAGLGLGALVNKLIERRSV